MHKAAILYYRCHIDKCFLLLSILYILPEIDIMPWKKFTTNHQFAYIEVIHCIQQHEFKQRSICDVKAALKSDLVP